MILVNFSYPLTSQQVARVEELAGERVERVIEVPTEFDDEEPFAAQVDHLLDNCGLSARDWQTAPVLVVLPSHNAIAATLLAELHGRTGHFPSVLRLCALSDGKVTRFELAEIIRLEAIRQRARKRRW